MAEEWTPTTDEVRDGYCDWVGEQAAWEERANQFDRWLSAHDAQVKAEAWDEARKRVQEAHPSCTDECGMCIARDEILDDLSANPYRAAETEATR